MFDNDINLLFINEQECVSFLFKEENYFVIIPYIKRRKDYKIKTYINIYNILIASKL